MCLGWVLSVAGGPGEAVDRPLTALPGPKRSVKTATRPQSTTVEFQRLSMISGRRACHPIRHLTHKAAPPWRKDLLTKLSCATESYCAGFLGLATSKPSFGRFSDFRTGHWGQARVTGHEATHGTEQDRQIGTFALSRARKLAKRPESS